MSVLVSDNDDCKDAFDLRFFDLATASFQLVLLLNLAVHDFGSIGLIILYDNDDCNAALFKQLLTKLNYLFPMCIVHLVQFGGKAQ